METRQGFWHRFLDWWSVKRVAVTLLLVAFVIGVIGYLNQHNGLFVSLPIIADFYANIATELASIAITVLVIDTLNDRRSIQQEKAALILQMDSPTNSIAKEAVRVLRARGWLIDGSLRGAFLYRANLQDAFLVKANLQDAYLRKTILNRAYLQGVNLAGAKELEDKQLTSTRSLRGAIMPDGNRYDGRFNLPGDIKWAKSSGVDVNSPVSMAQYYEVPLETYQRGQKWAQQNIARLRPPAEEKLKVASTQVTTSSAGQVFFQKSFKGLAEWLIALTVINLLLDLLARFVRQKNWPNRT